MAVVLKNNNPLLVNDDSVQNVGNNAFDGIKRLRVLDLSWSLKIEEIKEFSMSNLKHLRRRLWYRSFGRIKPSQWGLTIIQLGNVTSGISDQRANLKGKKNLNIIFLNWHTDPYGDDAAAARPDNCEYDKDEAVLEALQPHPNLKMLVIQQYFGAKLPWWMGDASFLPNLVILSLDRCTKCKQLVGFGKLPSLKELRLENMDGIKCFGNKFYYNNSGGGGGEVVLLFPSLKVLVLSGMGALEEWVDIPNYYSCFPCLEKIYIRCCPNLRITPTRFPSLKELILKEINERVAVPLVTTNSLEFVELEKISELKYLPCRFLQGSSKLRILKVIDCLNFQGFLPSKEDQNQEEGFSAFPEVAFLGLLGLPAMEFLPDIRSFTSLENLAIINCESFKPLPEDLGCLSSSLEHLKEVQIQNVKEVDDFIWQKK